MRGEHLFLHGPNRQDAPAQCDLARRGNPAPNRASSRGGDDRRGQRDSRGRAVLGDRGGGDVDVHIVRGEEVGRDVQLTGTGSHVRERPRR